MQEPISQVLKEILVYPKPITRKKTKAGTSDFPAHLSSDQMIRYLKAKDKKQAAEEEKRKWKDREIKKQQCEAQKQQRLKERAPKAQRKNARKMTPTDCRTDPVHEEEEDIICPACRSDSECPGG